MIAGKSQISSSANLGSTVEENSFVNLSARSMTATLTLEAPPVKGDLVSRLQKDLSALGFNTAIDGIFGVETEAAVKAFQHAYGLTPDGIAGVKTLGTIAQLGEGKSSQAWTADSSHQGSTSQHRLPDWRGGDRAATVAAIRQEARRQSILDPAQIAYILATVEHETAGSFQPVREGYYLGETAGRAHRKTLRYFPYYGRGYVQLTWEENYQRYSALTGLDLASQPDLVMEPAIALFILIDGMKHGRFSGVKLDDFTSTSGFDFVEARQIINIRDRAEDIAALAHRWLA